MVYKMMHPKFYIARRDTRWDVYPHAEPEEVIAYDGYFWSKGPGNQWFRLPGSYVLIREITEHEANQGVLR